MTNGRARWALAVFAAVAATLAFTTREAAHNPSRPLVAAQSKPRALDLPSALPAPRELAVQQPEHASDEVAIMRAHGDDSSSAPRHPHPITPEHARIFRENALLAALNGAVDLAAPEVLREFNQRYRDEFPEDEHELQAGYELIAECLEQLDDATRARARRYFDEERASTLRRYVKRYCLD